MSGKTWTTHEAQQAQQQAAVEAALAADREAALRDVFATAALGGIIAVWYHSTSPDDVDRQARRAYQYADAMLKARKK